MAHRREYDVMAKDKQLITTTDIDGQDAQLILPAHGGGSTFTWCARINGFDPKFTYARIFADPSEDNLSRRGNGTRVYTLGEGVYEVAFSTVGGKHRRLLLVSKDGLITTIKNAAEAQPLILKHQTYQPDTQADVSWLPEHG